MRQLIAKNAQWDAVLEADGNDRTEALHQAGNGRSFLGHPDEDLAGLTVGVKTDRQIAFMSTDREVVCNRRTLVGKAVPVGGRRT